MTLKDDLHKFVDIHIQEIKYISYGLGAFGLFLVMKDLHLASTFRHVSQVPPKFFSSHVSLQGCVQMVSSGGVLHVEHLPVFAIPFSNWFYQLRFPEERGTMLLQLAGVEMTASSVEWLSKNVVNQHVWFQLLYASSEAAYCSVSKKKNLFFKLNINEFLVGQGLAPTHREDSIFINADTVIEDFITRLKIMETKARKNKLGMWNTKQEEVTQNVLTRFFHWTWKKIKNTVWKK